MTLAEYLSEVLQSHGQVLKDLVAFVPEDKLLPLIDRFENASLPPEIDVHPQSSAEIPVDEPLILLEKAVIALQLPESLEDRLWTYPFYRAVVESTARLESQVDPENLIDTTLSYAQAWIDNLEIPPSALSRAQQLSASHWIQFRHRVLKKAGHSPARLVH